MCIYIYIYIYSLAPSKVCLVSGRNRSSRRALATSTVACAYLREDDIYYLLLAPHGERIGNSGLYRSLARPTPTREAMEG